MSKWYNAKFHQIGSNEEANKKGEDFYVNRSLSLS